MISRTLALLRRLIFAVKRGETPKHMAVAPKDSLEISVFSLTILTLRKAMTEY
jgi:hypothetical protein